MSSPRAPRSRELAVLVHGLAAKPLIMSRLGRSLAAAGVEIVNWGYASIWSPIEVHGRQLAAVLWRLMEERRYERIHLVTHSMGGIVARLALAEFVPKNLGRLVMIAPPNRGSHVAARLAPYLGRVCPPLVQLTDDKTSFVCSLPPPAIREVGIITAESDFMVLPTHTRLGCESDHITLPGLHSSVLWRRETADQVRHFLEHGRFERRCG